MAKVNIPKLDFNKISSQFKNADPKDVGAWGIWPKVTSLVLLLVALVAAGWYFYWLPKWEDLEKGRAKEVELKKQFEDKLRQAISLEALRKQKEQVAQFVVALEKQLPNRTEMAALLTEINKAGTGRGLQFLLFRPNAEVVKQFYAEQPIDVGVTGNYHDMGAFAADIATLSRIVTLNKIDIKYPTGSSADPVLTMNAEVKTYRYLDPEEQAAAKKAAASAAGAKK